MNFLYANLCHNIVPNLSIILIIGGLDTPSGPNSMADRAFTEECYAYRKMTSNGFPAFLTEVQSLPKLNYMIHKLGAIKMISEYVRIFILCF